MPRKKAVSRTETRADLIDKVFAQVDPTEAALGVLGALATQGGLTPPFTRLMMSIANDGADNVAKDWADLALKIGSPLYAWQSSEYGFFGNLVRLFSKLNPDGSTKSAEQQEIDSKSAAAMSMGAAEYILMYNLFSNPEFQKKMFEMVSGSGAGLAAIAKAL